MSDRVLYAFDNQGIATLTLNRPEIHNALDAQLVEALRMVLHKIKKDPRVKVVVLSAIGKNFCAGADLNGMKRMAHLSYEENIQDAQALSELMHTLKCLDRPTVAEIQGAAIAGGVGLVACCDIAIASQDAYFCLSETKIGLVPAIIMPYVMSAIGERATRYYGLTAENMSAEEACRLGLVSKVVGPDDLRAVVKKAVGQLLQNGPQALRAFKALADRFSMPPYKKNDRQKNIEAIARLRASPEGQEGIQAFLEKRKPKW